MNKPLQLVTPRARLAHLHASPCEIPVVRVFGTGPESSQVRLLGLALLVPLGQAFRQPDRPADLDVYEPRVRVVCSVY